MDYRKTAVEKWFLSPMLLAYEPPKTVAGSEQLEDALKALIVEAAIASVPKDWDYSRMEVHAKRLWDECLLGKKYTAGWPQVDAVRKASSAIVADMVQYDRKPLPPCLQIAKPEDRDPLMGEEHDFPVFYARMKREIEDAPRIVNRTGLLNMLEAGMKRHREFYGLE